MIMVVISSSVHHPSGLLPALMASSTVHGPGSVPGLGGVRQQGRPGAGRRESMAIGGRCSATPPACLGQIGVRGAVG